MSRKRLGIALVFTLVIGLVAWAVFGRSSSDESSADQAALAAGPDDGTGPTKAAGASGFDSTEALLRADKATLMGTVRDERGQAIAGAAVCAWADVGELRGVEQDGPRCAATERDGHYRIEGLWPVATRVSASARDFRPRRFSEERDGRRRTDLRLLAGQERRDVDFVLQAGGVVITGVVKDISGGVIEAAIVTGVAAGGEGRALARSDGEGRFELWTEPGAIKLEAQAEGYANAKAEARAPTKRAELFLTPESTISGVVVHAQTGAPVARASVIATTSGFGNRGHGGALSDDEGRFRITKLAPGIYDLVAETDELYGEAANQLHLGLAQSEEARVRVHPAFSVRGRVVVAESGEPCEKALVRLVGDDSDSYALANEAGEVLIRGTLAGDYHVSIECKGHTAEPDYARVVVADANVEGVEWRVHTGLAMRGVVVDSSGAAIEGVSVKAKATLEPGGDPRAVRSAPAAERTEADGGFAFAGLLPGAYELDVASEAYPSLAEPLAIELEGPGDLEGLRLVLPGTGALAGTVRDEAGVAAPGVTVVARRVEGGQRRQIETDDDGRFSLERLAVGEYRVIAQHDRPFPIYGGAEAVEGEDVTILEGRDATLDLVVERRAGVIRGRVLDPDGGPVTDAFVDATREPDGGVRSGPGRMAMRWGWERKPVLTDQDGSFEVPELGEGTYLVRAYREGGGEALLEGVAVGSSVDLTIVSTGSIAGKVAFVDGRSPERFVVQAYDASISLTRKDTFFRTDGAFELRELPPGTYELTATTTGGSAKLEVELAPGDSIKDLVVELVPRITIKGRLVDAETREGVPNRLINVGGRGGTLTLRTPSTPGARLQISDADGRFEIADASTGKVSLWIIPLDLANQGKYGGPTTRAVLLAEQPAVQDIGEIELHASRLSDDERAGDLGYELGRNGAEVEAEDRYLEIAAIRPDGPAAATGLEVGDRIVEVDGRSVRGLDSHRYYGRVSAPEGTVIELTIEGGKAVTIVVGAPLG